ncbi:MAG TPA: LytTR family DNA-binding domain-containing protein [Ohtaekwangia sp.]|uniref:LytR/AlgR family response regulator transcription factor n=1 Tax=Ohtaekwangia sp. TaxID=2066019 RepID=UPI002F933F1D
MKIIIIEDELKAAKSLAAMIEKLRPNAEIIAQLQSVDSTIAYLSEHEQPDLIFMDVQLSDGLCFEIFKVIKIHCPIIFCTAFGEYAMDAIKANGIDYLLKPFSKEQLEEAFLKVEGFKTFFQRNTQPDMSVFLKMMGMDEGKKNFLVFRSNKYTTVPTDQIAYFYIKNELVTIVTFQSQEYTLDQTMEQVQSSVSSKQFYRLNRQYLINFSAVKEVEHYFARKLFVKLSISTPEKLLIGKEKTTTFLQWLEGGR